MSAQNMRDAVFTALNAAIDENGYTELLDCDALSLADDLTWKCADLECPDDADEAREAAHRVEVAAAVSTYLVIRRNLTERGRGGPVPLGPVDESLLA